LKEVFVVAYLLALNVSLLIHGMYLLGSDETAAVWLTCLLGKEDPRGASLALTAMLKTKPVGGIIRRVRAKALDLDYKAGSTEIESEALRIIVEILPQQLRDSLHDKTLRHAADDALKYLSIRLGGYVQDAAREERWGKTVSAQQYECDEIDQGVDYGSSESSVSPYGGEWEAQQEEHGGIQNQKRTRSIASQEQETINFEQVASMLGITPRELRRRIKSGEFPKEPERGYTRAFVSDCLREQRDAIYAAGFSQSAVANELARQTAKTPAATRKWLNRNQDKVPRLPNGKYSVAAVRKAARLIRQDGRRRRVQTKKKARSS